MNPTDLLLLAEQPLTALQWLSQPIPIDVYPTGFYPESTFDRVAVHQCAGIRELERNTGARVSEMKA